MSVGNTNCYIEYSGDGTTTDFRFSFPANGASDIKCRITHTDGSTRNLESTEYSVVLSGTGGSVTVAVPPASGETLRIYRTTPITQDTGFDTGYINNADISNAMDKLTLIAQENRNAMAEVDSRSEEIAENVASATAETISGSMQALVGLAAENASHAYTYRNEALGYKNEALGYAGQAGSFCTTASGYMSMTNIAASNALGYMGSAVSAANSASAYKEQAYSHSISAGGYALSAGGYMSSASDYATAASGYADSASSAIKVSAGDGIVISGGYISAKVDGSTVGFDSNGALSCMVSGGGGGGIDTVSTFGGINAAINGNVLSLGAGEDFLETAEQNTSGFFNDSSRIAHLGFTSSGIRMGASYNDYDYGSAAAGINAEFNSSSLSPEIRIDVRNSSSGSYDNSTIIHGGGISTGIIKQGGGYTSLCQFYADDTRFGYYTTFHREGYWDTGSAYFKLTKSNFSMCVPYESGNYDDKTGMHIYLTRQDGGIGFGGGDTEGGIDYGVCFTTGGGDVPNGGLVFKTRGHNIIMQGSGGRALLDYADMLTVQNFPQLYSVAAPLSCSANDSSGVLALNYDSTVMSTTGGGALTLVSTPSDAVVSNFDSGGEFSRVHAGGFCVQGGHYEPIYTSNGNAEVVISLHTPFRDTNYVVNQQPQRYIGTSSSINAQHIVYSKTTSSFIIYAGKAQELLDDLYFDGGGDWVAMGFVS